MRLNAELLKARRHELGLSQEAFALACFERQLCVSIASVKRAETGKSLLLRTARHLAAFHGVTLQALLHVPVPDTQTAGRPSHAAPGDHPDHADHTEAGAGCAALSQIDGRLVQVLCLWPVSSHERAAVHDRLQRDGALVMPPPQFDMALAVFGLPRAQRGDVQRCLLAASRWRDRHVMVSGGRWLEPELEWPQAGMHEWVSRQSPGVHVHRSAFALVRPHHLVEAAGHMDFGRLGPAQREGGRQLKLAGRQHELRLFGSVLNGVLADQQSHVMLVQGMAGMGKSRLLAEMTELAQRHFLNTVQVDMQDFGADRHREVTASLLKALLGLEESTPFWEQLLASRIRHFAMPPDQALLCRDLLAARLSDDERATLQAMGHGTRGQVTVQLLARIVGRMALQRPMLVIVEDAHWASPSTIEALARVMAATHESQVLWVFSGRVEEPQRLADLQRMIPEMAFTSLSLAPLRTAEVQELMRQFPHVDESWRAQCSLRAQGHPLFLTQLLMADRHERLPDNFQHLLQVRLDELSPQDRHALRLAAVLGQPFEAGDLHALMQVPGYRLEGLVRHCLLRHLDGERHDFLHALIRQGIYEALPVRQREAMHVQVAEYFRPLSGMLFAQHLHLARQPRAAAALLDAAKACQASFDYEGALSLLQLYAGIDYAPREAWRHAMALGEVHAKMGAMPAARGAYEDAIRHGATLLERLSAKAALAGVLNVLEQLQAEEALIDEALVEAEGAAGAQSQVAALHYLKGNLYFPRGDVARSRAHHEQAMTLARAAGEPRLQAQALSGLGDAYYAEGLMGTAHAQFARCLALCDEQGLRDIEASNRFMLATTQIYLCQTDAALSHACASAELARRVGNRRAEIVARLTASWIELGAGRAQEALIHINEGLMISRAMGAMRFEPFLQEAQARALYAAGDESQAQRTIQAALEGVDRCKLHAFIGPWVMGTWALLHSHEDRAMVMLERGRQLVEQGCVAHNVYRFYACAMEVCTLAGQAAAARSHGEAWLRRTGREPTPWVAALHDFMTQCQDDAAMPQPTHPVWQALRGHQILHVMLKLPRVLLS